MDEVQAGTWHVACVYNNNKHHHLFVLCDIDPGWEADTRVQHAGHSLGFRLIGCRGSAYNGNVIKTVSSCRSDDARRDGNMDGMAGSVSQ